MDITTSPLPTPESFKAYKQISVAPYGRLMANGDVAMAFGVVPATLRKWRALTGFPPTVHKEGNVTFYKISDLVAPYYKRFPGELPDPELESIMNRLRPFADVTKERQEKEDEEAPLALQAAAQETFLLRIGEAVTEAVGRLVEAAPDPPSVIEAQAAELTAQRRQINAQEEQINALNMQVDALKVQIEAEGRWRSLPLLDRLRKTRPA